MAELRSAKFDSVNLSRHRRSIGQVGYQCEHDPRFVRQSEGLNSN